MEFSANNEYNMKDKIYLSYRIRRSWRIPSILTSTAPIACTFMDIDVSTITIEEDESGIIILLDNYIIYLTTNTSLKLKATPL